MLTAATLQRKRERKHASRHSLHLKLRRHAKEFNAHTAQDSTMGTMESPASSFIDRYERPKVLTERTFVAGILSKARALFRRNP
jgi:hypothetical protein